MMLPSYRSREAKIIEENLQHAFVAMSDVQKHYQNNQYVFSKIPHPIFNCITEVKSTESEIERTIESISEDYQKHNTPHCWWISERSEPVEISKYLEKFGYQAGPKYRGMHADLKKRNIELPESSRIRIERILRVEDFDIWVKPLEESFEFSKEVSQAFAECYKDLFVKNKNMISYIAFYDNQPAGAASLFLNEDSVGLYNGGVFSKFRNKGVYTQLLYTRLQEAKNQGFEDIIVQVNDSSYNMIVKAGFKQYLNFEAYITAANFLHP